MRIGERQIGPGNPPWVCAEISGEHRGDLLRCMTLISAAKKAGADSAKLQLYNPLKLAEARGGANKLLIDGLWQGRTLGSLYQEAHTPREWFPDLFAYAKEIGITLFSSVFHREDVEYLYDFGCPALKVASFELTDLSLIREAAATGLPVIISTGMGDEEDIRRALASTLVPEPSPSTVIRVGECALLHCVSSYPCRVADANLGRISVLRSERPHLPIGLSDHTLGSIAPVVATALGASIIEKHITLDRKNGGPDAPFSLEPHEFRQLVQDVKDAYASLGTGDRPASENIYRDLRRKG
jgi:sialic acid synthase SpsE